MFNITRYLAQSIGNPRRADSLTSRLRRKRLSHFNEMLNDFYDKYGCVNIIDIGGTRQYWNILPERWLVEKKITITIVNLPGSTFPESEDHFQYVAGDGCSLDFCQDREFHIAHSNAVIEHVGDWERMKQFAREVSRVAERYFVQTPNFWFPIEPHCMIPFFHWLPEPLRVLLIMHFNLGNWSRQESVSAAVAQVNSAHLLDKRMFTELFDGAKLVKERFLLLTKSFIAVR